MVVEKAFIGFQDTEFQKMMAMNFFLNNVIRVTGVIPIGATCHVPLPYSIINFSEYDLEVAFAGQLQEIVSRHDRRHIHGE